MNDAWVSDSPIRPAIRFDTKIAVAVRDDLAVWQKLNMTAFLISAVASAHPTAIGAEYQDASGNLYLPMLGQPVLVFAGDAGKLRAACARARQRDVRFALFTDELFVTADDDANRAAVRAYREEELRIAGFAFRAERRVADQILKGLSLHR